MPIVTAISDATTPTISDVRAPYSVRTKRSRPAPSAPNQNCAFGPFGIPNESSIVCVVRRQRGMPRDPGRERAAEGRDQDQEDDHDRTEQRRLVLAEALPEEA